MYFPRIFENAAVQPCGECPVSMDDDEQARDQPYRALFPFSWQFMP